MGLGDGSARGDLVGARPCRPVHGEVPARWHHGLGLRVPASTVVLWPRRRAHGVPGDLGKLIA